MWDIVAAQIAVERPSQLDFIRPVVNKTLQALPATDYSVHVQVFGVMSRPALDIFSAIYLAPRGSQLISGEIPFARLNVKRTTMSKRDDLIEKYAEQMKDKLGMTPDMDLLRKVTIGCGPSIYNRDSSTVAASDPSEVATVKNNFLMKKHGLPDNDATDAGLKSVLDAYSERSKYRAVVYYMLTKHFGLESNYS